MTHSDPTKLRVPFFRTALGEAEIEEVVACLRSGWLTTGPRTKKFEQGFAAAIGAHHAIAVNSGTAALHLGVESLGLKPGQAVLVPTMTFAATAEVVRYQGAVPILVDCDPITLNMDLEDAEQKIREVEAGRLLEGSSLDIVGVIPVHVGGLMMDLDALHSFAERHDLWIVEDAAHAFPSAYRSSPEAPWMRCGEDTAHVTCYSFYPNKTMTTGEGGMAATADAERADRIKQMSLHGLSNDAWKRYAGTGRWDYRIADTGFKYNLTDIASAIGLHQLERAESMRIEREEIARGFCGALSGLEQLELPPIPSDRIHSWHLFPIRLCLDRLIIDRNKFVDLLHERGVGFSVHWRPLHLHPYYQENLQWNPALLPVATSEWERLVSLPIFPGMTAEEREHVVRVLEDLCVEHAAP